MSPNDIDSLYASVYRNTGQNPLWLGYWINKFVQSERLSLSQLSEQLGISPDKLVLLCLCRTPRPDHFQEDVLVVCGRTGARVELVARIIRQEQAVTLWRGEQSGNATGWLLAASDRDDSPGVSHDAGIDDDEDEVR